jgi:hypothetical protein
MNGNDAIFDDDCQQLHATWQEHEEYMASQLALPPHKRDGYAEAMCEEADMRRKAFRENGNDN